MSHLIAVVVSELKRKPWQSPFQLLIGGLIIYCIALYAGPFYGCGAGNSDAKNGVFSCLAGEMSAINKALIVVYITLASLCWGKAVSLLERRSVVPK